MNIKALIVLLVAISFVSLAARSAQAAEEKALWAGAAGGLFVPNKGGSTARPTVGIVAGAKIGSEFGLGAYYLTSKKDEGGTTGAFDVDFYGVEGSYHFEGEAKGAYFGARLGIAKIDTGLSTTKVSMSPFHIGVMGGYNYWITNSLSIGGDVGFYSVSKGDATALNGTTVSVEGFSALSFLATLKFWL